MGGSRYLIFWVVLAAVFGTLVVSEYAQREPDARRPIVPLPAEPRGAVQGWRGPASLVAEGVDIVLAPLHADAERQAFDATALGARLGLPAGEPWRLEVQVGEASALERFDAAARSGGLRVTAGDGAELQELSSAVARDRLAPSAAPLLALFRPQPEPSATEKGRFVGRWVLWGRRPEGACQLDVAGVTHTLEASAVGREELPRFVATRQP